MEKNKNNQKAGKLDQNANKDYRKKETDPNNPAAGKGKQNGSKNTSPGQKGSADKMQTKGK